MVAAGVFLVARLFPLISAVPEAVSVSTALKVIAWVGGLTAIFGALIAVAQFDIKRILAYSTISQLGFMMLGLATGGVAVGLFHLITHAFFKALLFLGAGSVIHGNHHEQDIRQMGGLRPLMPITFATYSIGMMALAGVPVFFSGFWSKDAILHAAHTWPVSGVPFYLGISAAFLTAFYMTRQMCYVFFGPQRLAHSEHSDSGVGSVHESPRIMTLPLILLAGCAVLLGFLGTPAWPWFQSFLQQTGVHLDFAHLAQPETLKLMGISALIVFAGIGCGLLLYGRRLSATSDRLEQLRPDIWSVLHARLYVDEIYEATFVRLTHWFARVADWLDFWIWNGLVQLVRYLTVGMAWVSRMTDEYLINLSFDQTCRGLRAGGLRFARLQTGQVQSYLRWIALGAILLILFLAWEWRFGS
jgi:NADH-quinone oxidoreductase subunit L